MAMLASDLQNPEYAGATNPDALLHVQFYSKPVHQPFMSEKEGRPIFKDVDFIKIHTPGNQLNIIDVPANEEHKARFPMQWSRYQNGKMGAEQATGTPLAQWPMLTAAQAEELRALKFFTVEQIAGASDERIMQVGMCAGMSPLAFRDKAKRFLSVARDSAESEKYASDLKQRDEQLAAMQEQMKKMQELLEKQGLLAKGDVAAPAQVPAAQSDAPKEKGGNTLHLKKS